jgi:hypothetical protein
MQSLGTVARADGKLLGLSIGPFEGIWDEASDGLPEGASDGTLDGS